MSDSFASATVLDGTGDVLGVSHGDDRRFQVEFYTREIEDEKQSEAHNRRILKAVPYCRKRAMGDARTVWDAPVTETDKLRWPRLWAAYEKGEEEMVIGTPLDSWPLLSREARITLKNWGFKTVEQVAEVTDGSLGDMGSDVARIVNHVRGNAQKFIADQEAGANERRLMDELNERDNKIGALEDQMRQMAQAMERMQAERLSGPIVAPQETAPGYQPLRHPQAAPPVLEQQQAGVAALESLPTVEPLGEQIVSRETTDDNPSPRLGKTKLSPDQIAQIRSSDKTQRELAEEFGVSTATIRNYRK